MAICICNSKQPKLHSHPFPYIFPSLACTHRKSFSKRPFFKGNSISFMGQHLENRVMGRQVCPVGEAADSEHLLFVERPKGLTRRVLQTSVPSTKMNSLFPLKSDVGFTDHRFPCWENSGEAREIVGALRSLSETGRKRGPVGQREQAEELLLSSDRGDLGSLCRARKSQSSQRWFLALSDPSTFC